MIIIGGILVLFKYITRLASNEIFSPSNKIHREVGRAKDLAASAYVFLNPPSGATAPSGPGCPHCRGLTITLRHTHTHTHSVGLLWMSDQPIAETFPWQHTTLSRDRHPCPPPGGILTRNPSKWAAADPRHAATGIAVYDKRRWILLGVRNVSDKICG